MIDLRLPVDVVSVGEAVTNRSEISRPKMGRINREETNSRETSFPKMDRRTFVGMSIAFSLRDVVDVADRVLPSLCDGDVMLAFVGK